MDFFSTSQYICLVVSTQEWSNLPTLLEKSISIDTDRYKPISFYAFSEAQQKGHGLSNVLSKIVLGTTARPDFNIEEKASIEKDSREMKQIIREMADYLPKEDPVKGW